MSDMLEIARRATGFSRADLLEMLLTDTTGAHESLLRAWHILEKVKALLAEGTPPAVTLECIALMESGADTARGVMTADLADLDREIRAWKLKRRAEPDPP